MATKDDSRNHNNRREQSKGRKQNSQENQKNQDKREGSYPGIGKKRWYNLGRRWIGIHGGKNLCTKQQEGQGGNSKEKP